MPGWFLKGLQYGVRTTAYPRRPEAASGTQVGFPVATELSGSDEATATAALCPTGALTAEGKQVTVDPRLCIQCFRCVRGASAPMRWAVEAPAEMSTRGPAADGEAADRVAKGPFEPAFQRSVNILVVDAGDCGACLNEVRQLGAPQYNMHRLGFFITPTPRHADLLLVVGQVTDAMRQPLLAAYRAMPEPKRVAAVGSCALHGAPIGASFTAGAGVNELLPVDIEIPGSPPTPLAILQGLLVLSRRTIELGENKR